MKYLLSLLLCASCFGQDVMDFAPFTTGVEWDSDSSAFFAAATITDATQKRAVDYLVRNLKNANLWTNMVGLFPLVGGTLAAHQVNLKSPGTFNMTFTAGTHDANGFTGNGTTAYATPGINPTTVFGARALTNFHMTVYNRTASPTAASAFFGCYGSSAHFYMLRAGNDLNYYGIFNGNGPKLAASLAGNFAGLIGMGKTKNGDQAAFVTRLGVTTETPTASSAVANQNVIFLADNNSGTPGEFSNANIAFASVGWGLTAAELTTFKTIVDAYETLLSR